MDLLKKLGKGIVLAGICFVISGCAYNLKQDLVYENGKFHDRRAEVMSDIVERELASKEKVTPDNDSTSIELSLVYRF